MTKYKMITAGEVKKGDILVTDHCESKVFDIIKLSEGRIIFQFTLFYYPFTEKIYLANDLVEIVDK